MEHFLWKSATESCRSRRACSQVVAARSSDGGGGGGGRRVSTNGSAGLGWKAKFSKESDSRVVSWYIGELHWRCTSGCAGFKIW
jgi:hypothetical protein